MARKTTLKGLRKKLQSIVSLYIRTRDRGICCTCGTVKDIKEMQNGHFISCGQWGTRFDERNQNCQCYRCNIGLKGNMVSYYEFMLRKYGASTIEELKKQSHWSVRDFANSIAPEWERFESNKEVYLFLIDWFTKKLEELK